MGLLGLIVSSAGIHGIVAHSVAARTREIGIRVALGAPPRRLLRAIIGSSLRSVAVGAGVAAALLILLAGSFSHEFKAALFGLDPLDPAALAVPLVVLAAVVLTAAYLPARRALDIAPTDALRHEE
jgi:putative ABC transport system permease protein